MATPSIRFAAAVTVAAAALACSWFVAGYPSVIYDSWGYYYLSGILRTEGLAGWPTDTRTYGYPLFQLLVTGFRMLPPEEFRLVVFCAQFAAYLLGCAFVARRLARVLESPRLGTAAYALGVLNPVLLVQTTEPLSDLLSAVLVLLAVALCWRAPQGDRTARPSARQALLCFLCGGAAVAVRPGNVAVVAGLVAVWAVSAVRWRDLGWRHALAAVAGLVPPFVPQMIINHRMAGTLNPLIEKNLYRLQAGWGMSALKYGTLVIPGHSPFLVYVNPLYRGDASPVDFLRRQPAGYAATLLLHAFGLLDRDMPFTYITDLDPWYRWPLALSNGLLLYLAAAGLALALARMLRRHELDEAAFVSVSTAIVAGAYAALYLPVEVESRFGLPLQALAPSLVVCGLAASAGPGRFGARARRLVLAAAPVVVCAAALLSAWIARQRTNPLVESPANTFVLDPARPGRTPAEP